MFQHCDPVIVSRYIAIRDLNISKKSKIKYGKDDVSVNEVTNSRRKSPSKPRPHVLSCSMTCCIPFPQHPYKPRVWFYTSPFTLNQRVSAVEWHSMTIDQVGNCYRCASGYALKEMLEWRMGLHYMGLPTWWQWTSKFLPLLSVLSINPHTLSKWRPKSSVLSSKISIL